MINFNGIIFDIHKTYIQMLGMIISILQFELDAIIRSDVHIRPSYIRRHFCKICIFQIQDSCNLSISIPISYSMNLHPIFRIPISYYILNQLSTFFFYDVDINLRSSDILNILFSCIHIFIDNGQDIIFCIISFIEIENIQKHHIINFRIYSF